MENLVLYRLDGSDEKEESFASGPLSVEQELERFRTQWQEELCQQKLSQQDSGCGEESNQGSAEQVEEPSEEEQGVNAEEGGKYFDAIRFYRRAVQLVPDIEFRIGDYKERGNRVKKKERSISECSTDSTGLGEHEDPDDLSDLLTYFQKLKVSENGYCMENTVVTHTHMSSLPAEVLQHIFRWVVSSHLDVVALEYLSLVCRGFYICARDDELWRMICQKVWGASCGDSTNYGTFRDMYYLRPHLRYTGCYISKTSYYRQGEECVETFYKNFHLVEYYRYARFFPDGYMMLWTSCGDPVQCLQKLRTKTTREQGMMYGYYRLTGNLVKAVLKWKKVEKKSQYDRFNRKNRNQENKSPEVSFHLEFELCNSGKRHNSMLAWRYYSVISTDRVSGEKTSSDFELNNKTYPPLIFSRVKSYTNHCDNIL